MNSVERVRRAIHFDGPDRIPHSLPDGGENDIMWLWPPQPAPRQEWTNYGDQDRMIDVWGAVCYRAAGGKLGFGEVLEPPVHDITAQSEYEIPDFNKPDRFGTWQAAIDANARLDNPQYVVGVLPYGLFERCHSLVGLDTLFISLYEHPDHVDALLERLTAKRLASVRLLRDLGCDGVMGYDDWGLQDRLMMGLPMVRRFFLPHYHRVWALAHELGMDNWMHSCGYTIDVLPEFAEAGLDVAQLDQQENMGLDNLDRAVGGKLAFWCPVDIQRTMVTGSVEDVDRYVQRMMQTLGNHRGGLISKTYPSPDDVRHDPAKIAAACAAFRKYGVYHTS